MNVGWRRSKVTGMCSICKKAAHKDGEDCPYKAILTCTLCYQSGHARGKCPKKMQSQGPKYLEQLIPQPYIDEYSLTSLTPIHSSSSFSLQTLIRSSKDEKVICLEDLISLTDLKKYRIASRTEIPKEKQVPVKPLHAPVLPFVNESWMMKHILICHGNPAFPASQKEATNLKNLRGLATFLGLELEQSLEVVLTRAAKEVKFRNDEIIRAAKKGLKDPAQVSFSLKTLESLTSIPDCEEHRLRYKLDIDLQFKCPRGCCTKYKPKKYEAILSETLKVFDIKSSLVV